MVAAAVGAGTAIAGIAGSAMSASAAGDAADAQQQAAQSNLQFAQQQFNTMQGQIQPYLGAGNNGIAGYENLIGINGNQAQGTAINEIKQGPQYQGLMQTGNENILANASATGGLRGSNTSNTLANTSINTLNGLITQRLQGYGQLMDTGRQSIAASQAASTALTNGVTGANNQSADAQGMFDTSLANSYNSGLGSITQGINRYADRAYQAA
jgi:hypothetical protein